jgi:hypothetical protein
MFKRSIKFYLSVTRDSVFVVVPATWHVLALVVSVPVHPKVVKMQRWFPEVLHLANRVHDTGIERDLNWAAFVRSDDATGERHCNQGESDSCFHVVSSVPF